MSRMFETEVLQDPAEIEAFTSLLCENDVRSYLEVGAKFGGATWKVARALPAGSRVVVVDLPGGTRLWHQSAPSLVDCVAELIRLGYDASLIWGDSTAPEVVREVRSLGPFDAVLIDANHTAEYVRKDWANYGPMARIVAFHDISWHRPPEWRGVRIDVPVFWNHLKLSYQHAEIRLDRKGKDNGIGVLWR